MKGKHTSDYRRTVFFGSYRTPLRETFIGQQAKRFYEWLEPELPALGFKILGSFILIFLLYLGCGVISLLLRLVGC